MQLKSFFTLALCLMGYALFAQVPEEAPPPPPPPPLEVQEIFKVVEEMPRFPGCEDRSTRNDRQSCAQERLLQYIYGNLIYPKSAIKDNIEGMVVVSFIVEKDGTLSNARAVRQPAAILGEAAVAVVEKMNTDGIVWTPGKQRNIPVRVQFNLPVRFKLEGEPSEEVVEEVVMEEEDIVMEDAPIRPRYRETAVEAPPPPPPPPAVEEHFEPAIAEDEGIPMPPPLEREPSLAPPPPPPAVTSETFRVVEQMPRFYSAECEAMDSENERKNCAQSAMLKFIYSNLQYPTIAKENRVEGICVVQFIVEEDGTITDAKILRDIGADCGIECLRLINLMNEESEWLPGKQRGRAVRVMYNLPIKFVLED